MLTDSFPYIMITERHLFRLFINDEIQVPTLLHSLQACLDTSEDPSALFTGFMLLVLVLEQGLDPAKLVIGLALKMLKSGKVSVERRRFLCVMLLRYTSKRYLSFLRFDDQMSILLQQLFEAARKLSTGEERIAIKIAKETEELARVLSASPYALFIRPAQSPSKSPNTSRSPARPSLTPRTTIAETPSPAKGLSLLGKVRKAVEEASRELKGGVGRKVREVLRRKVDEAVKFCEEVDAKGEGVIEGRLSALLSSLDQLLHLVRHTPSPNSSAIEALFKDSRHMPTV